MKPQMLMCSTFLWSTPRPSGRSEAKWLFLAWCPVLINKSFPNRQFLSALNFDSHGSYLQIGMCAFPPASGYFVGLASQRNGFSDFSPAFYLFGILLTISAGIAYFMDLNVRMPAEHIMKNMGRILRNPKVAVFVLMMFFTGWSRVWEMFWLKNCSNFTNNSF